MTPMLLALMFGGLEAGLYFWSEHKAIEGVREGVRYASRLPMSSVCPTANSATIANIANVTRTGKLDTTAVPVVPGWTSNSNVAVTFSCSTYVSTGIYTTLGGSGATVTVSTSNLAYPSLFKALGVVTSSYTLNAWSSAAVIGI
jgi:Flp pilus assembly protein TadG